MSIQNVLIIGGTGMLGRPVVEQLLRDNFQVTVGTRSRQTVEQTFQGRVRAVKLDITDLDSTTRALEGHDAVHLNLPSGPKFEDCFANDYHGAKSVAIVALEAGIKRISYLSGSTVTSDSGFPMVRAKYLAEEAIRGSGVPFTLWRATWFMESLDKMVKLIFIARLGTGEHKFHWIAAEDYARMVSRSFKTDEAENKILYPFGPEPISYKDATVQFRKLNHHFKLIIGMSIDSAIKIGEKIGNWEMWFGGQLMKHFEEVPELGDPTETNLIVGPPTITLDNYLRQSR